MTADERATLAAASDALEEAGHDGLAQAVRDIVAKDQRLDAIVAELRRDLERHILDGMDRMIVSGSPRPYARFLEHGAVVEITPPATVYVEDV